MNVVCRPRLYDHFESTDVLKASAGRNVLVSRGWRLVAAGA